MIVGIIIGVFAGGIIGVAVTAVLQMAKDDDKEDRK